jgi:hypothetical protein
MPMTHLRIKKERISSREDKPKTPEEGVHNLKKTSAEIKKISDEFWQEIKEISETSEFPIWRMWR